MVLAVTHAFDESLVDTVVRANVNPIEKLERTSLILASAVQARRSAPAPRGPALIASDRRSARVAGAARRAARATDRVGARRYVLRARAPRTARGGGERP